MKHLKVLFKSDDKDFQMRLQNGFSPIAIILNGDKRLETTVA